MQEHTSTDLDMSAADPGEPGHEDLEGVRGKGQKSSLGAMAAAGPNLRPNLDDAVHPKCRRALSPQPLPFPFRIRTLLSREPPSRGLANRPIFSASDQDNNNGAYQHRPKHCKQ